MNASAEQANKSPWFPSDTAGEPVTTASIALVFDGYPLDATSDLRVGFDHAVARSESDYITNDLRGLYDPDREFVDWDKCRNNTSVEVWPSGDRLLSFDTGPELTMEVWHPDQRSNHTRYCNRPVKTLDPLRDMAPNIRGIHDVVTVGERVYVVVAVDEPPVANGTSVRVIALRRDNLASIKGFGKGGAVNITGIDTPRWNYGTQQHEGIAAHAGADGSLVLAAMSGGSGDLSEAGVSTFTVDGSGSVDTFRSGPVPGPPQTRERTCSVDDVRPSSGAYLVAACGALFEVSKGVPAHTIVDPGITVADLCRNARAAAAACP